ncbi:MAG: alpha-glucan family phosphorylase [Elusimicrobia bacterium]|nr:alpha-glucan family phosphorylase [Elusimicrobiota bacterium]
MTNSDLRLPDRLARLRDLSYNLWWSWHPEARALFKAVDRTLWKTTNHNPVRLLKTITPERIVALAKDAGFLRYYDAVISDFDAYLADQRTWFRTSYPAGRGPIAYFSAEFGVHNSLPIYSGGLGILAGDHCKSASDLGVPLIGVGFMYPQGYVHQKVGIEGWQQNIYDHIDWNAAPVEPVLRPNGDRMILKVSLGGWSLYVAVFQVICGRVKLYLMDTNVEGNSPADREVSGRLYGGDQTTRLRQELVLGVGGVRVLRELGIAPAVFHINEGHAAFVFLERLRELVAEGRGYDEALQILRTQTVFTTHTPVPAGHDVFPEHLIEDYFRDTWKQLGLEKEKFLEMARFSGYPGWNMTALAMRLSGRRNGVSRRHGQVSRAMWKGLWPEVPEAEVPVSHVTNGVHLATWVNQNLAGLYKRYLGAEWKNRQDDPRLWAKVDDIPDSELWSVHQYCKRELVNLVRQKVRQRWMDDRVDPCQVLAGGSLLDPEALTIGFARRFASYKRANLLFHDIERLRKLLLDPWRPVQLLFAGKAHPADDVGKSLIQHVYNLAKDPSLGGHIAFVEDYDMHVARYFVQGCDLWLNNPLPPLEACGTSGQKAAANGVPNLSVLDGWWEEGYNHHNGWAISEGAQLSSDRRDNEDAESLYRILEEKVVPLYYEHDLHDAPQGWIEVMRESIKTVAPVFCADRMVKDYTREMYMTGTPAEPERVAGAHP